VLEYTAKESTHHKRCIRRETCNEGSYHEQVIPELLALLVGAGHHQIMEYLPQNAGREWREGAKHQTTCLKY